jgi:cytidylate kinase
MGNITIAIDGYSSCGKSTLAKALAAVLSYTFIDSGAMYRGITLFALQQGLIKTEEEGVDEQLLIEALKSISIEFKSVQDSTSKHLFLNGKDVEREIRAMEVASRVSSIASIREVREKLVAMQRELGKNGGIVMDGRDIGSVVFPEAELKIFVTAAPEVRAQRRYLELINKGDQVTLAEVTSNLAERDHLDTTRSESPLIQTPDARVLDNTNLTPQEQLELALSWVNELTK